MSRGIAPATISSPSDLIQYQISDASTLDPNFPPGYEERHIHSAIYKSHPSVNCVVHSHAESVVPFTILAQTPLRPVYHMAGFLAYQGTPVFDIAKYLQKGGLHDMLVRNQHLGDALAGYFANGNNVTLMRGHGFAVCFNALGSVGLGGGEVRVI